MIRAVLFDIDDTLFPEQEYYSSGFRMVAQELLSRGVGPAQSTQSLLERLARTEDKGHTLDLASKQLGFPEEWVPDLVHLVRNHKPQISFFPDVVPALRILRKRYRLGCVTDGHPLRQQRKIEALGLSAMVDAIVITDELGGIEYRKPHPLGFIRCCEKLQVSLSECVVVGDSLQRDVKGARNLGMLTVLLRRNDSTTDTDDPELPEKPTFEINSLSDVDGILSSINQNAHCVSFDK